MISPFAKDSRLRNAAAQRPRARRTPGLEAGPRP